ncbi:MAG: alpha-ketoglutarate-dependent dioxygenase AlkB [Gammaproteobacteria bacterium]|nr:alpha-ketoglutarate-dependent dioxygenase AlkB [Gammaproteobacteria bacterium]
MTGVSTTANDNELEYEPAFLDNEIADDLLAHVLIDLPWREELVKMFGQTFVAPRISCALADEGCTYRYRGSQSVPVRFTRPLDKLRRILREKLGAPFNYVLATQYRNGSDYVGWHADDERDLVPGQTIANVSLGEAREFRIKNQDGSFDKRITTVHGSLLCMRGDILRTTKHTLIRTRRTIGPRVVLSFREVRK